jgi:biotin carboxyl carrier protein
MSIKVELTIPGNMWKVMVKVGDKVKKGDTLSMMEVMKMEVPHESPVDGEIIVVNVKNDEEGLDAGMVAVEIE